MSGKSEIKDPSLYPSGMRKIEWVARNMPLLERIKKDFGTHRYFEGKRVVVSVHLEAKTAYLSLVLAAGGAQVAVTGSNPLSTQDDVAAALAHCGLSVYARHGAAPEEYERHLNMALDFSPHIVIDDGGDLVHLLHTARRELLENVLGGCEETTTGVLRLRARHREGLLDFPMIAVNDAKCKYLFDNRYGTGQSVWDGVNRTTNLIVCGKTVVVAGYGWCGKGVAMRAKGLGAKVVVTEIDPVCAIEAVMDGFTVLPMEEAAPLGDFFITVTGCKDVITAPHFEKMKDGAILANAGHFDVEISMDELEKAAASREEARENITAYVMPDGRRLNVLGKGRLVNLAAGDGHPAEIMDMSFALQALGAKYILERHAALENGVYPVPGDIDRQVAEWKLEGLGVRLDRLTPKQKEYLEAWSG